MSNETPKLGEPGYDQYMADKYRSQKDGPQSEALTADGNKADSFDHITDSEGNVRVSVRRESTLGPSHQPESYTAAQADPAQVRDLERHIERIRAELAEVLRHDPRTGEPVYRITGPGRKARELQLAHLENAELPHVRAMQQQAAQWRAANVPTTLQPLVEERDRRDRLTMRAHEIADEREAQAMADRVQAQRRNRG